jgi:general secretion pathway protein I
MNRRGFTLIEVLVALAIAAIGLAAVLSVVTSSARNASYLRDKTIGSWIGLNQITTVRLGNQLPSVDKTDGEVDFANGKWKWQQTVTQTDVAGMRRIDVAVRHADDPSDQPITTVTGFVGRTQVATPPTNITWDYAASTLAPGTTPGATPGTTPGLSPGLSPGTPPGTPPGLSPSLPNR